MHAIQNSKAKAFQWVSRELKKNRDVILEAIDIDPLILMWTDDVIRDDKILIMKAASINGNSLQ